MFISYNLAHNQLNLNPHIGDHSSRGEGSVRSDKKVENEPFLKSISVYRYQEDII